MVATQIFQKLVITARMFMKKASWGCCVFLLNSSGEPAVHPGVSDACAPGYSGTEFEFGRTTSSKEGVGATANARMDYESSMTKCNFFIRQDLVQFSSLLSLSSIRSPSS